MKVTVFNTKKYDETFLSQANEKYGYDLLFLETHLNAQTAHLAKGSDAVCAFVNDTLDDEVVNVLAERDVRYIAMRCAGYNNVDLNACAAHDIKVMNVPAYSPHAVAEHTVGMILSLNRKFHRSYARVRDANFELEGLLGFDLYEKTVGVIGTGRIGQIVCEILSGFGCHVLAYDMYPNAALDGVVEYVALDVLLKRSDIVTLHCPLTEESRHMINAQSIATMKERVMLINTSRGALIDTQAVIDGLKSGKIGWLGLDVYEEEADIFFEDLSENIIADDVFSRLLTFPNVLITGHQAFFTKEALTNIAETTLKNLHLVASGEGQPNLVKAV